VCVCVRVCVCVCLLYATLIVSFFLSFLLCFMTLKKEKIHIPSCKHTHTHTDTHRLTQTHTLLYNRSLTLDRPALEVAVHMLYRKRVIYLFLIRLPLIIKCHDLFHLNNDYVKSISWKMGTRHTHEQLLTLPRFAEATAYKDKVTSVKNGVSRMGNEKHGKKSVQGSRQNRRRMKRCLIFH